MTDTSDHRNRTGWAAPFGHPAPDAELELRPEHGIDTHEAPDEPLADSIGGEAPQPALADVGDEPNATYPDQARLDRAQREHELGTGAPTVQEAPAPGPVRERRVIHVVQTEKRSNARASTSVHQVVAGAAVQLLGYDENRKRAVIQVAAATPDGYFLAIGANKSLEGIQAAITTDFVSGVPTALPELLRQSHLLQLLSLGASPAPLVPAAYVIEHVREVWAMFVPDSSLTNKGQFALVSVTAEYGDRGLALERPVAPGAGGDR